MQQERPYVLSIAGFDPCSGAGISADIKTFEQLKVYGLGICTGMTLQSENEFDSIAWRTLNEAEKELRFMLDKYKVQAVKFGVVPTVEWLEKLVALIRKKDSSLPVIVDPVWRSSTGFAFADFTDKARLPALLKKLTLITPNREEIDLLAEGLTPFEKAVRLSTFVKVLLKGGHATEKQGTDIYFEGGNHWEISPGQDLVYPKHGSGCVLSAAIAAFMANGHSALEACRKAKLYTEQFLASNKSLLGYHAA